MAFQLGLNGRPLPAKGRIGEMYYDLATNTTHVWTEGAWVALGVSGNQAARSKLDEVLDAALGEASGARHGKMLLGQVLQEQLREGGKARFGQHNFTAAVTYVDDDPVMVQGSDFYDVTLRPSAPDYSPQVTQFALPYLVLRWLLLDVRLGGYGWLPEQLAEQLWELSLAGPMEPYRTLAMWMEQAREADALWQEIDRKAIAQVKEILLAREENSGGVSGSGSGGGGGGHGQLPGDGVA